MFKCEQCGKNSKPGETKFLRRKFRILRNKERNKCGSQIIMEKGVCSRCNNKYGPIIR